jgi:hypothetical protein
MVWVPSQNCTCAVELFGHDETGESMGHGEGSERQEQLRAGPAFLVPPVGRPDREDNVASAIVAAGSEP